MNINELRYAIESSFTKCRSCGETIDSWPDADKSEPGRKVVYIPREALFVGLCSNGEINEFYLAEVKAGEISAHDMTERTLGQFVAQADCKHAKMDGFEVPSGGSVPTINGAIEGPAKVKQCRACGFRKRAIALIL